MNMDEGYIPTRRKPVKYHFIRPEKRSEEELLPLPRQKFSFYYQIATFPNPNNNRVHMRKFVINGKCEFVQVSEYYLTKSQSKKFYQVKKQHEYRAYPVYDLKNVEYPNMGEINVCQSELFGEENANYPGSAYAKF